MVTLHYSLTGFGITEKTPFWTCQCFQGAWIEEGILTSNMGNFIPWTWVTDEMERKNVSWVLPFISLCFLIVGCGQLSHAPQEPKKASPSVGCFSQVVCHSNRNEWLMLFAAFLRFKLHSEWDYWWAEKMPPKYTLVVQAQSLELPLRKSHIYFHIPKDTKSSHTKVSVSVLK